MDHRIGSCGFRAKIVPFEMRYVLDFVVVPQEGFEPRPHHYERRGPSARKWIARSCSSAKQSGPKPGELQVTRNACWAAKRGT